MTKHCKTLDSDIRFSGQSHKYIYISSNKIKGLRACMHSNPSACYYQYMAGILCMLLGTKFLCCTIISLKLRLKAASTVTVNTVLTLSSRRFRIIWLHFCKEAAELCRSRRGSHIIRAQGAWAAAAGFEQTTTFLLVEEAVLVIWCW